MGDNSPVSAWLWMEHKRTLRERERYKKRKEEKKEAEMEKWMEEELKKLEKE